MSLSIQGTARYAVTVVTLCLVVWIASTAVFCQSLPIPSLSGATNYLFCLDALPCPEGNKISFGRRYQWFNNVLSLQKGEGPLEPLEVTTDSPSYQGERLTWYEARSSRWSLFYAEGRAERIWGTKATAQAWLDARSKNLKPFYRVSVRERKGHWNWFGVSYTEEYVSKGRRGAFWAGLRYVRCLKFRDGQAAGFLANGILRGQIDFVSSRGVRLKAPAGKGLTLDAGVRHPISPQWTGLIVAENLWSQIRWRRVRRLTAAVDTGAFAKDPEGFIRDLPFLVGTESVLSETRHLERQVHLGVAYYRHNLTIGAIFSKRSGASLWNIGLIGKSHRNNRWLLAFQFPYPTLFAGYEAGGTGIRLGLSHPDPADALTFFAEVRISIR
ncbi:MAG: hypothetical protein NZ959_03365 [Armatimonadetes bacterium]|nr:hypothetical protein [Armatimonadota bacterium]MDW8121301.1 hypothetical protein [Armatimonadota bacterium]